MYLIQWILCTKLLRCEQMQLTLYTDYGLRVLVYLAALPEGQKANIDQVSQTFKVSRNHINKIVHHLGKLGWIATKRGKGGGFYLAKNPNDLSLAEIVNSLESSLIPVNCYEPECVLLPECKLKGILQTAMSAFIGELAKYTLADVSSNSPEIVSLLGFELS